ncbi:hypothetical protein EI28_00775 [Methanoculleus sp. MH98A]|nr:hypothetical protein EI28_04490 [Methanoculleus sp. MH98A]KDE56226.1 hypothetical protein EI28_00775 [Methanoculleus sp. MH98A]
MRFYLYTFSVQKSKSRKVHCVVSPVDRVFMVAFGAEDARRIEALMRFPEKRCYNRLITHPLYRHPVLENMSDKGILPVRRNIGTGEYLDRDSLARLHQQIKSKSGEKFAKSKVLFRRNYEDIDI